MLPLANKLKARYDNLPIKHKLFTFHFLIVLIVCLTSLVAIQIALHIYQEILSVEAAKVLSFSTRSIEEELRQIENHSYNIITNPEFQETLEKLNKRLSVYERGVLGRELTERLWTYRFERNIISVNVIDANGNQYAGGDLVPKDEVDSIVAKAAEREGSMVFLPPMANDTSIIGVRAIRKVRQLSLAPLGTLIIRVNIGNLIQQLAFASTKNPEYLFITAEDEMVYASSSAWDQTTMALVYKGNGDYLLKKIEGKNYFIVYHKSAYTDWMFINILPYDSVFKQVIQMRKIVLLIFVALFCLTILISLKMAANLTRPMETLIKKMKRVENGEFEFIEEESEGLERADEIGLLQRDFTIMVKKINTLIQENYTKQILVKDTQIKALQAQINPHFLYNTLESINWRAKLNQQPDISQMIESLGNLLRNAISDQNHLVPIREEIKLVHDYINIQKVRFGARLVFALEIDQRWEELLIPRLTLQPLVENSIIHGLEKMPETCRIRITATENKEVLFITVEDNGPGIPPIILQELEIGEGKADGSGLGLKNIDQRLKLIYGKEYGILITSKFEEGTKVTMRIPKGKPQNV